MASKFWEVPFQDNQNQIRRLEGAPKTLQLPWVRLHRAGYSITGHVGWRRPHCNWAPVLILNMTSAQCGE